jgi:hypothetical protein
MQSKTRAVVIHFAISLTVALMAFVYVWKVLYPPPLFDIMRASGLIGLLLVVDVVLGPLITSIIFSKEKSRKALLFDFTVIGAMQLSALIYGFSVVLKAAPAYIVFDGLRFDVVNYADLTQNTKDRAVKNFSLPFGGPVLVAAKLPSDKALSLRVLAAGMQGVNISAFPELYVKYTERIRDVEQAAESIDALKVRKQSAAKQLNEELLPVELGRVAVLPAKLGDHRLAALVSTSGDFIRLVNVDIW